MVVLGPFGPNTVILTWREVEQVAVCRGIGTQKGSDRWEGIGVAVKSFSKLISPLNKAI